MNKLITFALVLLSTSCITDKKQSNIAYNVAKIEEPKVNEVINVTDELYDLQIGIETSENNKHYLVFNIKLHDGSYFVSPHAKRGFKGKFYFDLGSYDNNYLFYVVYTVKLKQASSGSVKRM